MVEFNSATLFFKVVVNSNIIKRSNHGYPWLFFKVGVQLSIKTNTRNTTFPAMTSISILKFFESGRQYFLT